MNKTFYVFALLSFFLMSAQDGSPDSSFGGNGVILQEFDCENLYIRSSLELNDGTILFSASCYTSSTTHFLMQVDENGNLVSTYGENGILLLPDNFVIFNLHKQLADDSILIYGENLNINPNYDALYKISIDAEVDQSYGDDGALVITQSNLYSKKFVILDNGGVLIADYSNDETIEFVKYDSNGAIDNSFPSITTAIQINGDYDRLAQLSLSVTNEIFLGIRGLEGELHVHTIYRFNEDGTINNEYGTNGFTIVPEPVSETDPYWFSYTLLQNNEIIVSRTLYDWEGGLTETRIFKLNENGSTNSSFGNNGQVIVNSYAGTVFEQGNGKVLFHGTVSDFEGGINFTMMRFHSDGNVDNTFNFQPNFGEMGSYGPLHHSNGKIYILGSTIWYNAPPMNFIMLRYNNSPLGIDEENTGNFSVSPNPSKDIFTISQFSMLSSPKPYTIFDLKGILLIQGEFQKQNTEVDLSQYESGIYLLKVENSTFQLIKN